MYTYVLLYVCVHIYIYIYTHTYIHMLKYNLLHSRYVSMGSPAPGDALYHMTVDCYIRIV